MRLAPVLVAVLLAPAVFAAPADGDGETCNGPFVCAHAGAATSATCVRGPASVSCEFVFLGTTAGRSPLLLPGFASSSLDAILDWRCEPLGCAPGQVVDNVNALVTWPGGPDVGLLGLQPGESFEVEVLRHTVTLATDGTPACLHYAQSQESTVIARVPRVQGAAFLAFIAAVDGGGGPESGAACTT